MIVALTTYEIAIATTVGKARHRAAVRAGRPDQHGFDPGEKDGETIHIQGAIAELAVAKYLNVYWNFSVNTFREGQDVFKYQVRYRSKSHYALLVRPNDKDEDIFILVNGEAPNLNIVGWMKAGDAKKPEWVRWHGGRPPAFFVEHEHLRPPEELLEEVRKHRQ